ncbi:hypothetical protein [Marinobacterium sedimentorum]|uniref:hypothetical protein n=1 Tax=Marinobacterium sedimentorum TaxID=2927804 RepID=UPI0020C62D79|nr:hypothetical protein [Marinobacterium sedimentorum]MCP8690184.1 hypothetical protein [Marinobacterium sedimentorum]
MTLIPPTGLSSLFRAAPAAVPALGDLHFVACCCFHLIHLNSRATDRDRSLAVLSCLPDQAF